MPLITHTNASVTSIKEALASNQVVCIPDQQAVASLMSWFECQHCGGCCKGDTGFKRIYVSSDELLRIANKLGISRKEVKRHTIVYQSKRYFPTPCPFLNKNNECSIYTVRPKACQDHPKGEFEEQGRRLSLNCVGWNKLKEKINGN